jgi:hypothetical protein
MIPRVWGDVASWATAAGVVAAAVGVELNRRQARAAFEHEFVRRYWALEDDRLRSVGSTEVQLMRYSRLCEDEFEARRLGQVSRRTWEVWHAAIREVMADGAVDTVAHAWVRTCHAQPQEHPGRECPGVLRETPA